MSNFKETNQKIEAAVVGGYQKIEVGAVSGYKKIEDKFIETFLTKDGESIVEARKRITGENEEKQA